MVEVYSGENATGDEKKWRGDDSEERGGRREKEKIALDAPRSVSPRHAQPLPSVSQWCSPFDGVGSNDDGDKESIVSWLVVMPPPHGLHNRTFFSIDLISATSASMRFFWRTPNTIASAPINIIIGPDAAFSSSSSSSFDRALFWLLPPFRLTNTPSSPVRLA